MIFVSYSYTKKDMSYGFGNASIDIEIQDIKSIGYLEDKIISSVENMDSCVVLFWREFL